MKELYTGDCTVMGHEELEAEALNADPGNNELLNICEINQWFIYKADTIR